MDDLETRLKQGWKRKLTSLNAELESAGRALQALSPLAVLERGFSISKRVPGGELIQSVKQVQVGDQLATLVADGQILSRVLQVDADDDQQDSASSES